MCLSQDTDARPIEAGRERPRAPLPAPLNCIPDEEALARLERLASIGTLSAMMAHEIKNALVTSKTFVDLLLEQQPESELGGLVKRELGRIDDICSRVLRYANPRDTDHAPFHLHGCLDHLLKLLQPRMRGQTIELQTNFRAVADTLHGSEPELQQAFLNLFLNAVEAMGHGGTLTLTTENPPPEPGADQAWVRLVIQDTGPGVSQEDAQHMFQPFFTTKPEGTGLGLIIANRIVRSHHGTTTLDNPGQSGACFSILLPVS